MSIRRIVLGATWAVAVVGMVVAAAAPAAAEEPRPQTLANVTARDAAEAAVPRRERVHRVTFLRDSRRQTAEGRILVEAADGGVMLQSDDGVIWIIQGREIDNRVTTDERFVPATRDELVERLEERLPAGFRIHTTPHYIVCYDTSRTYAQWTSSLLERLYRAFTNYWERQGLKLHEPEFPLVAMVFADRATYEQAGREDLPGGAGSIVGYYSLRTNGVNMYDLTGVESLRGPGDRRGSLREINQLLSQPAAEPLVATIVHEATHQIAFNCGMQTRYADIPLWLCEGLAVYFEAPDLSSNRGWRGIGKVNYARLDTFRRNLPDWHAGSLRRLLAESQPFRNPRTAAAAYADAWALNYYLIKYRPDEFAGYLKLLSTKRPMVEDDRATRLEEFRQHFGDLDDLEQDFLRRMSRVD